MHKFPSNLFFFNSFPSDDFLVYYTRPKNAYTSHHSSRTLTHTILFNNRFDLYLCRSIFSISLQNSLSLNFSLLIWYTPSVSLLFITPSGYTKRIFINIALFPQFCPFIAISLVNFNIYFDPQARHFENSLRVHRYEYNRGRVRLLCFGSLPFVYF